MNLEKQNQRNVVPNAGKTFNLSRLRYWKVITWTIHSRHGYNSIILDEMVWIRTDQI